MKIIKQSMAGIVVVAALVGISGSTMGTVGGAAVGGLIGNQAK
jgi:hypothetical protein